MNALTLEWITKAEGDLGTARRELAVREDPNHDAVCFHAQQSAEKYLKARLVEAGISFPKTHDLGSLVTLAIAVEPGWASLVPQVDSLTDRAVEVRYPGVTADGIDAIDSVTIAEHVRQAVRLALGLAI